MLINFSPHTLRLGASTFLVNLINEIVITRVQ